MGKVQDYRAVAAVGRREVGGVVALFAYQLTVEQEAALRTDGFVELRFEYGLHGEVEDGGTVTAVYGLAVVGQLVCVGHIILRLETIVVVRGAGTNLVVELHGGGLVNGQVQGHGAVAVVRRGQLLGINT